MISGVAVKAGLENNLLGRVGVVQVVGGVIVEGDGTFKVVS